ncbi:MAG: hypothetical protein RH949_24480, partial [Coleofasciculus sp. A1-SPW-01]|uniref:hypothetical protein n=1 Tax=Coleofasciculus sp. A1-SPW-01 TaxID=3070819 RepID=UPI0032F9D5C1
NSLVAVNGEICHAEWSPQRSGGTKRSICPIMTANSICFNPRRSHSQYATLANSPRTLALFACLGMLGFKPCAIALRLSDGCTVWLGLSAFLVLGARRSSVST